MKHGRVITGLMAMVLLLTGCAGTQTHQINVDLAPTTGALAVDVENFRGPVEIRADSRFTTPSVRGVVHVRGKADKARKRMILDAVDVTASIEETGGRGVLRVRAVSERERYDDHVASLEIRVPRCDGVRVVSSGGAVVIVGAGGAAEVTNREGAIEYRTARIVTDPITLTTVDGSIFIQIPEGSTGDFDLETLEGRVSYRDKVTADTHPAMVSERRFKAVLAQSGHSVVARTNRGDINVWVHEDPVALVRMTRKWSPPLQDRMFLQSNRRYTRNLPDDHPEVTGESPRATTLGLGRDYE